MITFEEFFKKKKISLPALQQGEPSLFAEFEQHYAQMGEKSFDHTKKYWFNGLRRRFPLPPEVKTEKLVMENQLAEQTITESLTENASPTGFKPRFKPGTAKPAPSEPAQASEVLPTADTSDKEIKQSAEPGKPALGFKPKFETAAAPPVAPSTNAKDLNDEPAKDTIDAAPKPALGFKPKFKAGVTKPATEGAAPNAEDKPKEEQATETPAPKPALGFKPKFKAPVSPPAQVPEIEPEHGPVSQNSEAPQAEQAPPKPLGFKPKFKPPVESNSDSQTEQQLESKADVVDEDKAENPQPGSLTEDKKAEPAPKSLGFKPRFSPKK